MTDEATIKINVERGTAVMTGTTGQDWPDDELVRCVLAGDDAAFALLFERYKRLVVHLVSKFFRQHDEIEDMSQQSFTKIYTALKDFRGGSEKSFSSWLSRVTVNVCYDELRRRGRHAEASFEDFSEDDRNALESLVSANGGLSPEQQLVSRDLAAKVLAQLDPKERLALTLLHGEEMSVAEVARIVGWSESNVKTRLFRCRNQLRQMFQAIFQR